MTTNSYSGGVLPLRSGEHKPTERLAKQWAGGVGWHDSQPWTPARTEQKLFDAEGTRYLVPPVKTRIVYPERTPTRRRIPIPLEFDWSPFTRQRPECYPVCRHTRDQCPTNPVPHETAAEAARPPIPDPEPADTLPGDIGINPMAFDEKPWLDSAPLDVQAKAKYTNFSNDHSALVTAFEKDRFTTDARSRWHRAGWGPGDFWRAADREHRRAATPKPCTSDASAPPDPGLLDRMDAWRTMTPQRRRGQRRVDYFPPDSAASFRGRSCQNCLARFGQEYVAGCAYLLAEKVHAKVKYCSERCRNRAEYVRRRDIAGTVRPGVELSSLAVDGRRIGIDTDDQGFCRLLASVAQSTP